MRHNFARFAMLFSFILWNVVCLAAYDSCRVWAEERKWRGLDLIQEESGEFEAPAEEKSPAEAVEDIRARGGEWTEPSQKSEAAYLKAVRVWLDTLPDDRRELARSILRSAHPTLHGLREAIRDKRAELININFDKNSSADKLPRLGLELQGLRAALRAELKRARERLSEEADVDMGPLAKDTFWLSLPEAEAENKRN